MNQIFICAALLFTLSLCNLTDKLKGKAGSESSSNANSGSSSTTSPPGSGGASTEQVERPKPTAAQTAALEGGQAVTWDEQGMTWTLPKNWSKISVSKEMFNWGGDGAFIIVNISPMSESFPTDASLQATYEGAKTEYKNGKYEEVRWLELDGVKGVQHRESMPEGKDDPRRLQWRAYRKFAGQVQLVSVMLTTSGSNFAKHQDLFYAILYSTKIVH